MDAASRPPDLTTPAGKRAKVPAPRSRSIDVRLARRLLKALGNAPLEFVLGWSGERVIGPGSPVAQIRFADRATLWSVAADPRVSRSKATCWTCSKSSPAVPRPAAAAGALRACCRACATDPAATP